MLAISRFGGFGLPEIFIILLMIVVASALPVIAFWKICSKAGFPPALSLLMIVPVANIVLPLYVGFTDWPVFKKPQGQETEK